MCALSVSELNAMASTCLCEVVFIERRSLLTFAWDSQNKPEGHQLCRNARYHVRRAPLRNVAESRDILRAVCRKFDKRAVSLISFTKR